MRIIFLLIATSVAFSSLAYAAASGNGKVDYVRVDKDGRGVLSLKVPLNVIACGATYYPNALAFDANTAGGKIILATALAAQAEGINLSVVGTGACGIWGNWIEDAGEVYKFSN